jgi:glycosyltransferase involved in cell wall biosynthesis
MQSEMNKDAVKYLVLELFPEIRKRISGVKLLIAGSSISATIESFENIEDVTVSGYVPDLGILFQSAKVLILPLRSGSGVKGRILEAMESGLPVVCTTMAAEGLSVINGVHMIIEDTNERIIEGVVTLLNDDQKREKIALNARRYFDENYSWEKTYGRIHEILGSAIQRK